MVDTLHHTIRDLLTNLDTSIVSSLLLVVASIGTLVETLDKVVDVSGVNIETAYEILLQTLSLSHTDGVTQSVDITLQTRSWSLAAT